MFLRSFLLAAAAIIGATFVPVASYAQDANTNTTSTAEETQTAIPPIPLQANAGEDRNVLIGRTVLFDASASTGPEDKALFYEWDFGDGTTAEGIDATHIYTDSGTYRVNLTVTSGQEKNAPQSQDTIIVSVQDRIMLLIADQSIPQKDIRSFQDYALTQGVLLVLIRNEDDNLDYVITQNLAQQMLKNEENIIASDVILTWTAGNIGLNALTEFARLVNLSNTSLDRFRLGAKAIVAISDQSVNSSAKIAQATFQNTHPRYIIVSDKNIIDDVIRAQKLEDLERALPTVDAEYQLVSEYTLRGLQNLGPFNFISYLLNDMINRGVPLNSIYLILMLPVMATIIAAARQLVGIKAFGIFAPTVIALSFLSTGLKYGITIFLIIIVLGTISRIIARKFNLLYLPRMALVLSMLAFGILGMFYVGAFFDKTGFIGISIFPILIMTVITEHFVSVQIEQGFRAAVKLTAETLALSVLGFLIGDWNLFRTTILAYPELILVTFAFNYLLGKFSGLRLTELIRFRNIFKHMRNAEKSE